MIGIVRAAGVALVAALALTGCSGADALTRVEQVKQDAGKAMLPAIAIGECSNLDVPDSAQATEVGDIPKADCGQPHGWETYAEKQYALEDAYPGQSSLETVAGEFCQEEFERFVGTAYDDSALELQYLFPSEATWTSLNDRTVTCLVGSPDNDIVGSLKGSKK